MSSKLIQSKANLKSVPWGLPSGVAFGLITLIITDFVASAVVIGIITGTLRVSVPTALQMISGQLGLTFAIYAISRIIGMASVYGFVRSRGGNWRDLGFRKYPLGKMLLVAGAAFVGFILSAAAVSALVGQFFPSIDLMSEQQLIFSSAELGTERIMAFVALVIIAPITEETIFRGFLLPAVAKPLGLFMGVLLTGLLFGVLHPPVSAMIAIGIFGIFLSYVYVRTNSLWTAILLHIAKNLIAFIAIF